MLNLMSLERQSCFILITGFLPHFNHITNYVLTFFIITLGSSTSLIDFFDVVSTFEKLFDFDFRTVLEDEKP